MNLTEAEEFKKNDAGSYDDLVTRFDRMTESLSGPLAATMVRLAGINPSDRVLDIGTGTGIVALRAAENIGEKGNICGIDLSKEMLSAASAKSERAGIADRVEFRQMDAESLEFEPDSFDAVVSLFALLHFPNPLAALAEIYRVLRPGGRAVVAVGSGPPMFSLTGILHLIRLLPDLVQRSLGKQLVAPAFLDGMVNKLIPKPEWQEESHLAGLSHKRTENVSELVRKAGFEILETHWEGHRELFDNAEEFWEIQRTFSSTARKRLLAAGEIKTAEIRRDFVDCCESVLSKGGSLVYPFAAYYVVGQKPR